MEVVLKRDWREWICGFATRASYAFVPRLGRVAPFKEDRMRILLTALVATLFLAGCPEEKKEDKPAKDTAGETKPAATASAAEKKEGEGW